MFRTVPIVVSCALMAILVACGSSGVTATRPATSSVGVASAAEASASEATASPEPTPTSEPTPDAAAFAEEYEDLSAQLAERTCPLGAMIDEGPGDPAAWQEAMAGFGPAWDSYAEDLATLDPPASVAADVETLIDAATALAAAADEIAGAPADIDEIYAIFEATYVPARDEVAAAGEAIRTALEMPPRDENPCD